MAAGIGDPLAVGDGIALLSGELRKPVGPVIVCAVGGRGIDYAHIGIVDQRDRFAGSVIGKTQKDNVRGIDKFPPLIVVVPLVLVDPQEFQIIPCPDPVKNLQTGRAALSVDVYFCFAHVISFLSVNRSKC